VLAGEFRAIAAEPVGALLADPHVALGDGFGLFLLGVAASVAGVMLAQERLADSAVHAARGNQVLRNGVWHRSQFSGEGMPPSVKLLCWLVW